MELGEFYRERAEAADGSNPDARAFLDPVDDRFVDGSARTHEGAGNLRSEALRDLEGELCLDPHNFAEAPELVRLLPLAPDAARGSCEVRALVTSLPIEGFSL